MVIVILAVCVCHVCGQLSIRGVARPDTAERPGKQERQDDMRESSLALLAVPGYHLLAGTRPRQTMHV